MLNILSIYTTYVVTEKQKSDFITLSYKFSKLLNFIFIWCIDIKYVFKITYYSK